MREFYGRRIGSIVNCEVLFCTVSRIKSSFCMIATNRVLRGIVGTVKQRPSGPVAQVVEQLTFNQWVEGSNPSGLTILFPILCGLQPVTIFHERVQECVGRDADAFF